MQNSKLSSQLSQYDEQWENQETQPVSVQTQYQKKRSKIQYLIIELIKIQTELRDISRNKNLKEEDILLAFHKGMKFFYDVDIKDMLEKGKELFQICSLIASQLDQEQDIGDLFEQLKTQRKKQEVRRKEQQKIKQVERSQVEEKSKEREKEESQKTVKRVPQKYQQEKKEIKDNKQPQKGREKIEQQPILGVNNISQSHIKNYMGVKFAYQNCTDQSKEQAKYFIKKEQNNVFEKVEKKEQIPEMFLPIDWERKQGSGLQITGKEIRKISQTRVYQNICASKPLINGEVHRIKFKVLQYGTLAIGLLPSNFKYKNQKCVSVEKQQALKYIAFQNGGGQIQLRSAILQDGPHVGLTNNLDLEMIVNTKDNFVTFQNQRLGKYKVDLPESFRNYNLYLYFEMKQQHTRVRFY